MQRLRLIILLLSVAPVCASAQERITVTGRAYDAVYPSLMLDHLMVISQRSHNGIFANPDNTFTITVDRNDTIMVAAAGYESRKICYRDSVPRERYTLTFPMKKLTVELKGVTIMRDRTLPQIEDDIKDLGYNPLDYRLHGSQAWMSPISALYSAFSKKEKAKRRVAEWMNRDRRVEVMKEILRYYERAGLMNLPEDRYDDFIAYLHLSDELLQSFSQYDLAVYIKGKYFDFRR